MTTGSIHDKRPQLTQVQTKYHTGVSADACKQTIMSTAHHMLGDNLPWQHVVPTPSKEPAAPKHASLLTGTTIRKIQFNKLHGCANNQQWHDPPPNVQQDASTLAAKLSTSSDIRSHLAGPNGGIDKPGPAYSLCKEANTTFLWQLQEVAVAGFDFSALQHRTT